MATAPPIVYITQTGPLDYSPAESYGSLVALAHGELTLDSLDREVMQSITSKLRRYRPGVDYILLSGSPLTIAWVCLLIAELAPLGARHLFLKWDKQRTDSQTRERLPPGYDVYEIVTPIAGRAPA